MLFWLFVIVLVVGVICIPISCFIDDHTRYYNAEWLRFLGIVIAVVAGIAILISGFVMIYEYSTADAYVELSKQKYESLTYQLENNLYDNDNDLGKKELYDEIREWNEDLAYYKEIQDDFWLGIFYPNVFDQFEFIPYNQAENGR